MPRLPLVISLLTVRALFGQSIPVDPQNPSPNSVVQLKRTPAPQASTPQKTDTFVDHFDFGANVRALAHIGEAYLAINEGKAVRSVQQLVDDLIRVEQVIEDARRQKSQRI